MVVRWCVAVLAALVLTGTGVVWAATEGSIYEKETSCPSQ
jgi:hypothetical protein